MADGRVLTFAAMAALLGVKAVRGSRGLVRRGKVRSQGDEMLHLAFAMYGDFWPPLVWSVQRGVLEELMRAGGKAGKLMWNDPQAGQVMAVGWQELSGIMVEQRDAGHWACALLSQAPSGQGFDLKRTGLHLVWDPLMQEIGWEGHDLVKGDRIWTDMLDMDDIATLPIYDCDDEGDCRKVRSAAWEPQGSASCVDEGFVGGHWGSEGSGLLITDGVRMLLARRSDRPGRFGVDQPGTWGIPGGAVPVDDRTDRPRSARASAIAETKEELGHLPSHIQIDQKPVAVYKARDGSGFQYSTFVGRIKSEVANRYSPVLNWEHTEWGWFERDDALDLELHPGVRWLLDQRGAKRW